MKLNFRYKILIFAVIFCLSFITIWLVTIYSFLNYENDITSKVIIIEGWMPDYALKEVGLEIKNRSVDKIYVTGIRNNFNISLIRQIMRDKDEIAKYDNSSLIMKRSGAFIFELPGTIKKIDSILINTHSTKVNNTYAHFLLYLDNHLVNSLNSQEDPTNHSFRLSSQNSKADFLTIFFDNDIFIENEDRNLFINDIIIYHQGNAVFPENYIEIAASGKGKEIIPLGFPSYADFVIQKLIKFGLDSTKLIPVPYEKQTITRTQSVYNALKNKLSQHKEISSFEIFTLGIHSRRSYLTAHNVFKNNFEIGINAIPDRSVTQKNWIKTRRGVNKILNETISLIFVFFI